MLQKISEDIYLASSFNVTYQGAIFIKIFNIFINLFISEAKG